MYASYCVIKGPGQTPDERIGSDEEEVEQRAFDI